MALTVLDTNGVLKAVALEATLAVATAEVLDNLVKLLDDKSLSLIIQQDVDKMSFEKFKHSLKNFDDNERARTNYHSSESVMHFKARGLQGKNKSDNAVRKNVSSWSCGQQGHVPV